MICPNCGKQISDGAQFCRYCGHRLVGDAPKKNQVQVERSKTPIIVAAAVAVIAIIALVVTMVSPKNIDIGQYIDYVPSGADGSGSVDIYVDYSALANDIGNKKIESVIDKVKADAWNVYGERNQYSVSDLLSGLIYYSVNQNGNLSNGDYVTVNIIPGGFTNFMDDAGTLDKICKKLKISMASTVSIPVYGFEEGSSYHVQPNGAIGQLRIITDEIRVRNTPSNDYKDTIIGHVYYGEVYEVYEIIESYNFTWYRIGEKRYVGSTPGEWTEFYPY